MKLGIENLVDDQQLILNLQKKSVALLCHAASVNRKLQHSMDVLAQQGVELALALGPQHGLRAEKQDNMIESNDYTDPKYQIPVFSLYGKVRRPTDKMMAGFDLLLVDLQDVGCRIYTFLTTLFYCIDACETHGKELWVLDRPNPAGRPVEGTSLNMKFETFVGAAPVPIRHGLTLGEAAQWYRAYKGYSFPLKVVKMSGYCPEEEAWPKNLSWVNPSPNMPRLSCAKMYAGTVLLEGTLTSEGRGTTLPLEMFGAPGFDGEQILQRMQKLTPNWLDGCLLRPCFFEPTFHKHAGEMCGGLQIHVDCLEYSEERFQPYRLVASYLKAVYQLYPNFELWRSPPYEYEEKLEPIDILSGDDRLRHWVESDSASAKDFETILEKDEKAWLKKRASYLLY